MKNFINLIVILIIALNANSQSQVIGHDDKLIEGSPRTYKTEKFNKYSDQDIFKVAAKYRYAKDSLFENGNKLKKQFSFLYRFNNLLDIESFLEGQNEVYKTKSDIMDFKNEKKKVRTLTQFINLHKKHPFNKGRFMDMKTDSQEYKEFIAEVKSGKTLMWLDKYGEINYGDVSVLSPGVTPKLPKGSIIISPE